MQSNSIAENRRIFFMEFSVHNQITKEDYTESIGLIGNTCYHRAAYELSTVVFQWRELSAIL